MKLYHYPERNFGDALNTWLWPQLLPGVLDDDPRTLFVGIGTLLNDRLPRAPLKIIFGAGVGYGGGGQPLVDARWRVYCLRGPLSAAALGLPANLAITDAAALLRVCELPTAAHRAGVAFMPHWLSARYWDWRRLCAQAGLTYIDPDDDTATVLRAISGARLVLAEAMHGAIVADALRVPWVALRAYGHVLAFKWLDWCHSLDITYEPHALPALYTSASLAAKVRRRLGTHTLGRPLAAPAARLAQALLEQTLRGVNNLRAAEAARALERLAHDAPATLSSDAAIETATARLVAQLERLKGDFS